MSSTANKKKKKKFATEREEVVAALKSIMKNLKKTRAEMKLKLNRETGPPPQKETTTTDPLTQKNGTEDIDTDIIDNICFTDTSSKEDNEGVQKKTKECKTKKRRRRQGSNSSYSDNSYRIYYYYYYYYYLIFRKQDQGIIRRLPTDIEIQFILEDLTRQGIS